VTWTLAQADMHCCSQRHSVPLAHSGAVAAASAIVPAHSPSPLTAESTAHVSTPTCVHGIRNGTCAAALTAAVTAATFTSTVLPTYKTSPSAELMLCVVTPTCMHVMWNSA
jgi:hypothetical protein